MSFVFNLLQEDMSYSAQTQEHKRLSDCPKGLRVTQWGSPLVLSHRAASWQHHRINAASRASNPRTKASQLAARWLDIWGSEVAAEAVISTEQRTFRMRQPRIWSLWKCRFRNVPDQSARAGVRVRACPLSLWKWISVQSLYITLSSHPSFSDWLKLWEHVVSSVHINTLTWLKSVNATTSLHWTSLE